MKKAHILWDKMPYRKQTFPEIPTEIGDLDLHGFATFKKINFNVHRNTLAIYFVQSEVGKLNIGDIIISRFEIVFKNPIKYILSERDTEMPKWCDKITEDFVLFENKEFKEIQFSFHGGRTLLISAESAIILFSPI